MLVRIVLIISVAFSCLYGVKQLNNGYNRKYFTVALCGMTAALFSRLFYLILCLSSGDDELMSLGVFGQSSAYLFFTTANSKFLSHKFSEDVRHKVCIPAFAGSLLLCAGFAIAAIKSGLVSEYVSEVILALFLGSSFYYSMSVVCFRKKYEVCGYVFRFNICICILIVTNMLQVLFNILLDDTTVIWTVVMVILAVLSIPCILLTLPVLRKGMKEWKE